MSPVLARVGPWLLVAALAVGWLRSCQQAERAVGVAQVALASARAAEAQHQRRADSLARAYVPQQAAAVRWKTRWQVLRDTLPVQWDTLEATDTVRVPVEVLVTADSAIASCHVALTTCEQRVAAERAVTATVRTQLATADSLAARDWTAAGLAYDPHAQRFGGFVDRDWSRLRAGLSVTPEDRGIRVGLRLGWRW